MQPHANLGKRFRTQTGIFSCFSPTPRRAKQLLAEEVIKDKPNQDSIDRWKAILKFFLRG